MKAVPLIALAILFSAGSASAALVAETVAYTHEGKTFQGYLVYDDVTEGERPGILVIHEWWGLNDYIRGRADRLAREGFVVLAADMFGDGAVTANAEEAAKLAGPLREDRSLMRERARAALAVLRKHDLIAGPGRIAAIGYCFGGTAVLELARSGADIAGAASFHGGLDTPNPEEAGNIRARVLILHGSDDPFVPLDQVAAFMEEMRRGGADWQMNIYGGAVHSFTNPASGRDRTTGTAYNEKADRRSWAALMVFLRDLFR
jgi:dienelactone hydrolase